jgi:hypothetical protein
VRNRPAAVLRMYGLMFREAERNAESGAETVGIKEVFKTWRRKAIYSRLKCAFTIDIRLLRSL